jgi:hypothetical protein
LFAPFASLDGINLVSRVGDVDYYSFDNGYTLGIDYARANVVSILTAASLTTLTYNSSDPIPSVVTKYFNGDTIVWTEKIRLSIEYTYSAPYYFAADNYDKGVTLGTTLWDTAGRRDVVGYTFGGFYSDGAYTTPLVASDYTARTTDLVIYVKQTQVDGAKGTLLRALSNAYRDGHVYWYSLETGGVTTYVQFTSNGIYDKSYKEASGDKIWHFNTERARYTETSGGSYLKVTDSATFYSSLSNTISSLTGNVYSHLQGATPVIFEISSDIILVNSSVLFYLKGDDIEKITVVSGTSAGTTIAFGEGPSADIPALPNVVFANAYTISLETDVLSALTSVTVAEGTLVTKTLIVDALIAAGKIAGAAQLTKVNKIVVVSSHPIFGNTYGLGEEVTFDAGGNSALTVNADTRLAVTLAA